MKFAVAEHYYRAVDYTSHLESNWWRVNGLTHGAHCRFAGKAVDRGA